MRWRLRLRRCRARVAAAGTWPRETKVAEAVLLRRDWYGAFLAGEGVCVLRAGWAWAGEFFELGQAYFAFAAFLG